MYRHYLQLLPLLLCLAGCGQTGPLYLPEKTAPPPAVETPSPPADEQTQDARE